VKVSNKRLYIVDRRFKEEDEKRCAATVKSHAQCHRSRGLGPGGEYCWQHAKRIAELNDRLELLDNRNAMLKLANSRQLPLAPLNARPLNDDNFEVRSRCYH